MNGDDALHDETPKAGDFFHMSPFLAHVRGPLSSDFLSEQQTIPLAHYFSRQKRAATKTRANIARRKCEPRRVSKANGTLGLE